MTIYTPNIIISKNYSFMNNFMEGRYFSELNVPDADDAIIFNKKQNRYVYSLEHSFNYGEADLHLTLKIVDVDGTFENQFFNETFYQRQMNNAVKKYVEDVKKPKDRAVKFSDFQLYVSDLLDSQIRIYVAYGIGDDLQTWTDPIVCTLVGANIDVSPNGVRNYTYKFIPEINNFFRPELKKDDNNPNEDVNYDFGAVSVETSYKIKTPDAKDVRGNIYKLLKGFCGKACNINEDNVIVVLPDFNSSISNSDAPVSGEFSSIYRNSDSEVQVLSRPVNSLNFNNMDDIKFFYSGLFKHVRSIYSKSRIYSKTTFMGIRKYVTKQDVITQLQADLTKSKEQLQSLNRDINNYQNINKLPTSELMSLSKQKSQLEQENIKLEEVIQDKLRQGIPGDSLQDDFYKKINNNKEIKRIEDKISTIRKTNLEDRYKKRSEENNKFKKLSSKLLLLKDNNQLNDSDTYSEYGYGFSPDEWHLEIRAEGDITNDPNKIPFPNWRKTINDVFKGIATIYNQGESYITPQVSFETNLRWLKFFKDVGLITDPTKPCLIVGDRQMVLDYIYCNQIPLTDIQNSKCNFPLNINDPLQIAHNVYGYKSKVIDLVNRKRNSSSFGEKLYLDELQLDRNNPLIKDTNLTLDDITKKYDIPIFVNNFKNSNVISYSLKNTENYISSLKYAVRSNRLKYLYSELSKDEQRLKVLFESAGITDPNPIKLATELFTDTVKSLPKEIQDIKFNQIDKKFNEFKENFYDKTPGNRSRDEATKYFEYSRSGPVAKFITNLYGDTGSIAPTKFYGLGTNQFYSDPLILTQNSQNVSYLNLAIQKVLYSKSREYDPRRNAVVQNPTGPLGKIDYNNLAAIAEFIILLNATNEINGGNTVTFIPGLTMPNRNFILSRIHEYNVKFSLNLTIKTLPFFNLTDARTMNKPCIFYSKRVSLMGVDPVDVMDFFTGEYRIVGFRHVITTSECYSEFSLSKYLTADEKVG